MEYIVKVREQNGSVYLFSFRSPDEAKQKMEWRKAEILKGWWNNSAKECYVTIIDTTVFCS